MSQQYSQKEVLAFFDVAQTKRSLYAGCGGNKMEREADELWQHGVDALLQLVLDCLMLPLLQERFQGETPRGYTGRSTDHLPWEERLGHAEGELKLLQVLAHRVRGQQLARNEVDPETWECLVQSHSDVLELMTVPQ